MKKYITILILCFSIVSIYSQTILFDLTKDELAGNADWTIGYSPNWIGGISDFGQALRNLGYTTNTLNGNNISSSDLANCDVFVIPEPQNTFSQSEKSAIINFVQNGGGLLLIGDHDGADRNGNGWDAIHVYNETLDISDNFGFYFNYDNEWQDPTNNIENPRTAITTGVNAVGMWGGSTINTGSSGVCHIWLDSSHTLPYVVSSIVNQGKVVAMGDSSPFDDGTGNPGNNLYDGWNDLDDATLGVNIINWLLSDETSPITISNVNSSPAFPTADDDITISCEISAENSLNSAILHWKTTGAFTTAVMDLSNNTYSAIIPNQPNNTNISYYITVSDNDGNSISAPTNAPNTCFHITIGNSNDIYNIQYTTNSEDGTYPSDSEGQIVTVHGVVTATDFGGNSIFISDPCGGEWHGICVDGFSGNPQIGDIVQLTGTISEYYGFTKITDLTSSEIIGNQSPIQPIIVTTAEIASNESLEGVLCRIENVHVTQTEDNYNEWYCSDNSSECQIDDGIYQYPNPINIGDTFSSIMGVVDYAYNEYSLNPRDINDFNSPVSNDDNTINSFVKLYPNPFNPLKTTLNLNVRANSKISIYNLKGQKIRSLNKTNLWDGKDFSGNIVSNGIYFVKISSEKTSFVKKIMVVK